jgi:hypothetical protein
LRHQVVTLVQERLEALRYVESQLRDDSPKAGPAFERWANATAQALYDAGLKRECQLFQRSIDSIILNDQIENGRAALKSLLKQLEHDPAAFGLNNRAAASVQAPAHVVVPVPPPPSDRGTVMADGRSRWALPATLLVGVLLGTYGRGLASAAGFWLVSRFRAAQATVASLLSLVVDLATPGPPPPMPWWVESVAFWLLVSVLGSWAAILLNVLGSVAFQHGTGTVWRRHRWQFALAVTLSAIVAALTATR